MYSYFYIRTKSINITWSTKMIEQCIDKSEMFSKERQGGYEGIGFFCSLGLMKVKDWDGWNNNDYDCQDTNYVSIVTSNDGSGTIPRQSMEIMEKLSVLLSEDIYSD